MSSVVLDASALLALIFAERGGDIVAAALSSAVMTSVNYSEVATRLYDQGMTQGEIQARLETFELEVVAFDREIALAAAALRPLTRHVGLSLGDRACLALAGHLGLPAMTADRPWAQLDVGVPVQVIR